MISSHFSVPADAQARLEMLEQVFAPADVQSGRRLRPSVDQHDAQSLRPGMSQASRPAPSGFG